MTGSWWKGALLPFGKKPVFIKCTNSSLETLISSKGISKFSFQGKTQYWVANETSSTYGG